MLARHRRDSRESLVSYTTRLLQEELAHRVQGILLRRVRQERACARRVALEGEEFSPRVDGGYTLLIITGGTHRLRRFMKGLNFRS